MHYNWSFCLWEVYFKDFYYNNKVLILHHASEAHTHASGKKQWVVVCDIDLHLQLFCSWQGLNALCSRRKCFLPPLSLKSLESFPLIHIWTLNPRKAPGFQLPSSAYSVLLASDPANWTIFGLQNFFLGLKFPFNKELTTWCCSMKSWKKTPLTMQARCWRWRETLTFRLVDISFPFTSSQSVHHKTITEPAWTLLCTLLPLP